MASGMNDQDAIQHAYARAVEHFQDGRIGVAEQELSDIIRNAPQVPEPYFLLGKVYQIKQQPAKAEEIFSCFRHSPKNYSKNLSETLENTAF